MAELTDRVGEIVEASTTDFVAQCYELYQSPPLGRLVKTIDLPLELYGIVYQATTISLESGRRPIARGKDEASEEDIYRSSPQLLKLLCTEFSVLVLGYRGNETLYRYLPPNPARIHSFVYLCGTDEIAEFGKSFYFLNILLNSHLSVSGDELVAASLRQMAESCEDSHAFLVGAGKELAMLLGGEFSRLKLILSKIK